MRLLKKIEDTGVKDKHVLIDITSGTKTFSIVASALTFNKEIVVSYLNNQRDLRIFDIRPVEDKFQD